MRTHRQWIVPLAIGVLVGAGGMQALHAQAPAVTRNVLTKADLTGVEGKEVLVTLLEAAPGAEFPAHTHPGDEFLYVIDGSIEGFIEQTRNPGHGQHPRKAPRHPHRGQRETLGHPREALARSNGRGIAVDRAPAS